MRVGTPPITQEHTAPRQVSLQTDITITDEDGQDAEEGVQSLTLALKGLGEKRISIKTSALEEKTLACAVLAQVLEAGGAVLLPFVEQLVPVLVPLLKFAYVEDVRENAAECMPALVKCVAGGAVPAGMVQQLVHHIVPSLMDAVKQEPNSAVKVGASQPLPPTSYKAVGARCKIGWGAVTGGWKRGWYWGCRRDVG